MLARLRVGRERRSLGGSKKGLSWSAAMSSGDAEVSNCLAGSTPYPSETKKGLAGWHGRPSSSCAHGPLDDGDGCLTCLGCCRDCRGRRAAGCMPCSEPGGAGDSAKPGDMDEVGICSTGGTRPAMHEDRFGASISESEGKFSNRLGGCLWGGAEESWPTTLPSVRWNSAGSLLAILGATRSMGGLGSSPRFRATGVKGFDDELGVEPGLPHLREPLPGVIAPLPNQVGGG